MTTVPPADTTNIRYLWLAALAGPVAWSIYFMLGYSLTEFSCTLGILTSTVLGLSLISIIIIVLTLLALAGTIYAGWWAYRLWRVSPEHELGESLEPASLADRPRLFMVFTAIGFSAIFSLLILLTGIPALVLRPC
jgi:hypothetical protein